MLKKLLFSTVMLVVLFSAPTYASSSDVESSQEIVSAEAPLVNKTCIDQLITTQSLSSNTESIVTPLSTCRAEGGVSRINWLADNRYLTWSVDPIVSVWYNFQGWITIINTTTGNTVDTIPISCSGYLNGPCGDDVSFSGSSNTLYTATLYGYAEDVLGAEFDVVEGGCPISFLYK